ncbi:MAG: TIGR04255 family protein [Clostridium sp.]
MVKNVNRSDIKYNFLKKIIIRVDYNGVLERELESTIEGIKRELKKYKFDRFTEGVINQVDFEIKDPEKIETQRMIPIAELNKTKTFIFLNSQSGEEIQINKYFMSVSVDYEKYKKFEEVSEIFQIVIKSIRKENNYIRFLRLGLRKINNCILLDLDRLNEVIEERYFSNLGSLFGEEEKVNILEKQSIDSFTYDNMNINLIRYISGGVLELDGTEQEAFQLVLDIDVYENSEEHLNELIKDSSLDENLKKYNTILFKSYIGVLSDKLIKQLIDGNIDNKLLLGVEKND